MSSTTEARKLKVLVTGFGPFQNVEVNESWQAVSGLWELDWPSQVELVTRELPVVYDTIKQIVPSLWDELKPDLVIHCGVSRADTKISVEQCSYNKNYNTCDINGGTPANLCCVQDGEDTLKTQLNVDSLCSRANSTCKEKGLIAKCELSTDPGRYLCAYIYYISLARDSSKSLFVHVPSKALIPVKEMSVALREIILDSLNQLYGANF